MEFLQHGFIGLGTVANVALIVIGSLAGMALGGRLSSRTAGTVTDGLALVVLVIAALSLRPLLQPALNEAVGHGAALVVILLAVVAGSLLGSALHLEERMEQLGEWVRARLSPGGTAEPVPAQPPVDAQFPGDARVTHDAQDQAPGARHFVDGFVTATLVFCVGPLAILGALSDGLGRGPDQLLVKAVLDGFASLAFASSMGAGVLLSAVPVALYQGSLTVVGRLLGDVLPTAQVDALTVAGGIVLLGLSLRVLGLKPVRVADMLPALVLAPLFVWLAGLL